MTLLDQETLQFILPDTTHILERNGQDAYVYLRRDGACHMLLDTGETRTGKWRVIDHGYATEWDGGQKGDWTLEATDEGIAYVSRDGKQSLKMRGILFGDAKNLSRQAVTPARGRHR